VSAVRTRTVTGVHTHARAHVRTNTFGVSVTRAGDDLPTMSERRLDVRDVPAAKRHERIHEAFAALAPGETLEIVNDHDPQPLFYEFREEVPAFDPEGYEVDQRGEETVVARLPKVEVESDAGASATPD
jgi:uncharacterized protein (DUF2249 family)